MKAYPFFTVVCLLSLSACAPYQLVPVEPVVDTKPLVHHQIDVVFDEEPVPAPNPVSEPGFQDLPPSAWTVQIAALKKLDTMAAVESSNDLEGVIRVPTHDSELGELHTVLVGVYETQEDAEQVAQKLPNKIAGDDPWIRSVASVQAVMR